MYGVEPSAQMLNEARNKSNQVQWLSGTAESIPIASDSLDGAIATLTIHHWHDLERAFQELGRVVKAGGDLVFFTAAPEQMAGYWLNHYFPEMLAKSIRQMPKLPELATKLAKAGFAICQTEPYSIRDDLKDFFLYAGKNKPELYLHDEMRKGISAFATLANQAEVNAGLAALRSDYERGKWQAIQHQYANQDGDYLFLVAQKRS